VGRNDRGLGSHSHPRAARSVPVASWVVVVRAIVLAVPMVALPVACAGSGSSRNSSGGSAGAMTLARRAGQTNPATERSAATQPVPHPTHTSCHSVVYIGDSTSEGEVSADYVPNSRLRLPAQLAKVGVRTTYPEVSGARSIIETYEGIPNGATVAQDQISDGFHGCWILALGTNDAADVAAGSAVGLKTRISRMMSIIGNQPVMWVNVITLYGAPEYYGEGGMRRWNVDLLAACAEHPMMRVFDWAAHAKPQWFIPDGVHYSSPGYVARARLIAHGLVMAFPTGEPPSTDCLVR
jgi:hypothetical protein